MRLSRRSAARRQEADLGRLVSRPGPPSVAVAPGLHTLAEGSLLYVPPAYDAARPWPLAVMLHGAGGVAQLGMRLLEAYADEAGLLLLAPGSRGRTWDMLLGDYGPDVRRIDAALAELFARCAVDTSRLALGGFSDGASYALSLGLTNGDLFTHIIALSPGFVAPASQAGRPRVFISHGTGDTVLPIDRCSRQIVPRLQGAGYDVTYTEFDGPHTVPPAIARRALAWFGVASGGV
jgi:phospholipase/carboxylesterase